MFGLLGYDITDQLNLTGELRQQQDKKDFELLSTTNTFPTGTAPTLQDTGPATTNTLRQNYERTFNSLAKVLALRYKANSALNGYLRYGEADRPGGFNNDPDRNIATSTPAGPRFSIPYEQEHARTMELGIKTEWFQRALRANLAVYRSEMEGILLNNSVSSAPPVSSTTRVIQFIENGGDARIEGAELDLYLEVAAPGPDGRFIVEGSTNVTSTRITAGRFDGKDIPQTRPKASSLGLTYQFRPAGLARAFVNVNTQQLNGGFQDPANVSPMDKVDILNINLGLRAKNWFAVLNVANVNDYLYITNYNNAQRTTGYTNPASHMVVQGRNDVLTMQVDSDLVARWLSQWDAIGWHRTGTPGDRRALEWLSAELREIGLPAQRDSLGLERRTDTCCVLGIRDGGMKFLGSSLFDAPTTPPGGIHGRLVPIEQDGEIGFTELRPDAATTGGEPFAQIRARSRHSAIVVATRSGDGELAPLNAPAYRSPYGPPVIQVAGRHMEALMHLALHAAHATVEIQVTSVSTFSWNLVSKFSGSNESLSPVLVITPRTSWYESVAERGGGLAAWLALGIAGTQSGQGSAGHGFLRNVELLATTGHEIGHLGIRHHLSERLSVADTPRPHVAIHLGANLGAQSPQGLNLRATQPSHALTMQAALIAAGYPPEHIHIRPIESAVGEARDLIANGIDTLSLVGENLLFHAPGDRWPGAVSLERTTAVAQAVVAWTLNGGKT